MSDRLFVRPARPGLRVRREDASGHIPAEGERVALTTYIRRRLRDGDLVRVETPSAGTDTDTPAEQPDLPPRTGRNRKQER